MNAESFYCRLTRTCVIFIVQHHLVAAGHGVKWGGHFAGVSYIWWVSHLGEGSFNLGQGHKFLHRSKKKVLHAVAPISAWKNGFGVCHGTKTGFTLSAQNERDMNADGWNEFVLEVLLLSFISGVRKHNAQRKSRFSVSVLASNNHKTNIYYVPFFLNSQVWYF